MHGGNKMDEGMWYILLAGYMLIVGAAIFLPFIVFENNDFGEED